MSHRWQDIRVTPGSLATRRLPRPLAPRRFEVRPDDLAQAFAAAGERLGAADVAVASEDRRAGPWARLFQNEPAWLYAQLLSFRADDAGFEFAEALEQEPASALSQISALAARLDGWLRRIRLQKPVVFSRQLEQMDKEVALTTLVQSLAGVQPSVVLRRAGEHRTVREAERSAGALAAARATRERLRAIHTILRNAVSALQPMARKAFDARIVSGGIDPGLGLLIAELRTAGHVDAVINQLPARHTQHYYRDIIGQKPADASPEMVLLDLGKVPRPGVLKQGAGLEALLPDGTVQQFSTEAAVPLSTARISDICVLSYETNPDISYNRALAGITGLRAARIGADPRPDGSTLFASGSELPLDTGLDIASPVLSLAEGTRRIEVTLHMRRASNLPAGSRPLTRAEIRERAERRKASVRASVIPDLRRNLTTTPEWADPEVRLALAADTALVRAFCTGKTETAAEELTHGVTEFAAETNQTTSLSLVYRYLMNRVERPGQLRLLLGRIVTLSLIEQYDFPAGDYWDQIYALVQRFRPELTGRSTETDTDHGQSSMIFAAFSQKPDGTIDYPPEDVFQSLLGDAFDITVTTEDGPLRPDIMQVLPIRHAQAAGGITLSLRYDESAPALTGPEHAPVLALRYATDSRLCPVSFFESYTIETVAIRTQVTGLRRLAAFSDTGPVVTDQTFRPFGPRPRDGATFQVGCAEMGRKPVTRVSISLSWSGMPDPLGGFDAHYEAYGRNIEVPAPELTVEYLSGDGWKPVSDAPLPLFQTEGVTGALLPAWEFTGQVSGHSIPATGVVTAAEYQSRQTVRAGMIRMRLAGTADGFLAGQYPVALVNAMRPRLLPLGTRKIPPAPYVPEISRFSLAYTAEATIELNAPDTARPGETVHQVGPFGRVGVFPQRMLRGIRLFPERMGYGHVAFQLTGADATGPVTLAFDMAQSGHLRLVPDANPIRWKYLSAHGWADLPETALSSDTTAGLMRSGLVVIDLPDDATDHSPEMPAGGVWLAAVATRPHLEIFPALSRVSVNGVWVCRRDDTWKNHGTPRTWSFSQAQPGLSPPSEIVTPAEIRPPEPPDAFTARVGERLRHRRRGVRPWDMERMVLEKFPEVWMAKCLPHLSRKTPAPAPGTVTLVVTRKPTADPALHTPAPALFDVATLERIRDWLSDYVSEEAQLDVVNPTFERLQVRAKLSVTADRENGAMAQMLRRDLARYLSVWTADDSLARFGWSLNVHMLRAHIAALPYVDDITDFSVLHLVGDDARSYQLLDTAQEVNDPRGGTYGPVLTPRFPWSLPLSTADHILTILPEIDDEAPSAAGIGNLTVGDMLIVGQRNIP
ncbi:hypothetical protein [uncultured Roseobacter sp.]|uniref:hypothetical protein n=1 Tax=uncultured Roseobacter sp. TaxID=114847 RepID=UPI002634E185|nr:hypothetical protein [uncultured Roseobacter sp.]